MRAGGEPGRAYDQAARIEQLAALLRRAPLFEGLGPAELRAVVAGLRRVTLRRGHILFSQGDPGNAAYFVHEGRIDLSITTPEGRELIVNQAGPGDVFGEMALLEDTVRSASAVAKRDCVLYALGRGEFLGLLQQHPNLTLALLRSLSARLRRTTDRATDLAFRDVPSRLAKVLLDLDAERRGDDSVQITHERLAGLAGTSRQTATLVLNDWRRAGLVELARGRIRLLDRESLRERAEAAPDA